MARDPLINTTLGRYHIDQRIGQGGMGTVYRAHDEEQGQVVAVKVLLNQGSNRASQLRLINRFLREGQAAATVRHANVVQVFDSGASDGTAYLVMELVDGMSLGEVLAEANTIDPARTVKIGAAIARGLGAIHAQGIVHRDIKPDNILLGKDGSVIITDLGLAKMVDDAEMERLTASGIVVGTPLYVAPEAIRDAHRVGPEADIYSLGTTLYHLLCGHPPFGGDSPYELMRAHLESQPRPLREINPAVPKWLAATVHACIAKDPEHRPSARELALSLTQGQHFASGPRRPLVAVSAALGLLLLVGILLWWRLGGDEDPGDQAQLTLVSHIDDLQWRLNGGPWQDYAGGKAPLALTEGKLEVRAVRAGIELRWHYELQDPAGEGDGESKELRLIPDLRPQALRLTYRQLPADGLLLVAGEAVGSGDSLRFTYAGEYPVVQWSPRVIRETLITVDADGARDNGWRVVDWPSAEAYWSTTPPVHRSGTLPPLTAIPRHHVVSNGELAMSSQAAAAWQQQSPAHAPARNLNSGVLRAWEERMRTRGITLPNRPAAIELSAHLGHGVWFRDDERLYYYGAPEASQALLVAVPQKD